MTVVSSRLKKSVKNTGSPNLSSQITTSNLMSRNSVGVAFTLLSGARILGATRASMITLLEPPTAALVAWLIFGETFTGLQWLGFATVLGSLFMFEIPARPD